MLDERIHFVRRYGPSKGPRREFAVRYTVPTTAITLYLRGVQEYRFGRAEIENPCPFLILHAPGTPVQQTHTSDRDSWSIQVITNDVRAAPERGAVEILNEGSWLRTGAVIRMTDMEAQIVEQEFRMLADWLDSPLPRDRFLVHMGFIGLLRRFVEKAHGRGIASPADSFKKLIDGDREMKKDLAHLSRACGYSPDYLRDRFREKFGVTPHTYRNNMRMIRARQLVEGSRLSVKQIAALTGFLHVSHFSALFKKYFHVPPSTAIRMMRRDVAGGTGNSR